MDESCSLSDKRRGNHQPLKNSISHEQELFSITKKLLIISSGQFDVGSIKELSLAQLNIGRIDQVHKCYNLESLDLSHNQISAIEKLEPLTKLKTLKLSHNRISKLEGLDKLKNLTCLDLANNNISNLKELVVLSPLEKLKSVNFKNNPISMEKDYETQVKRYVPNLKYIDGDHVLLRIPISVYQDEQSGKQILIPEEKSWTVMKNGKSIWDNDDHKDLSDVQESLTKTTQDFSDSMNECRKLLNAARSLEEDFRKIL